MEEGGREVPPIELKVFLVKSISRWFYSFTFWPMMHFLTYNGKFGWAHDITICAGNEESYTFNYVESNL